MIRSLLATAGGAFVAVGLCTCAVSGLPGVSTPGTVSSRVPVVLVPGVTGTELVDATSGDVLWGTGWRLLFPHDRGHAVARPLGAAPAVERVVAGEVLTAMRLGPFRKEIYGPVRDHLEAHGWVAGDLQEPDRRATYFSFAYDWRQSNVASAATLRQRLEAVRVAREADVLEFDLICQSNGAHVCRYLAKYGGRDLAEAETGATGLPEGLKLRKLILVGASNGGSLRMFRMMHRGRRYLGPIGRLWSPEVLFTFPAFFQDLPSYRDDLFLGPDGTALTVSLWQASDWLRYGWSIFDREVADRLRDDDRFGSNEERRLHLERELERARRFRSLLAADLPLGTMQIYVVEAPFVPTPERAILLRTDAGRWSTLFTGDPRLEAAAWLHPRTYAPGDHHATHDSVWHLSASERRAVASEPLEIEEAHFEMILHPATLQRLVEWLGE